MPIIQTNDKAATTQIATLVAIAYDPSELPHEVIITDVFLGDADLRIQAAVPNWAELTGNDLRRLRIITMKACAINILAAYARVTSEGVSDLSESKDQLTITQAILHYEDDISRDIKVLNPSGTDPSGRYVTAAVVV